MAKKLLVNEDAGKRIAAATKAYEAERASRVGTRTETQATGSRTFLGVIAEDDYTDNRYLVRRAHISNAISDPEAVVTFEAFDADHPLFLEVTATNFVEGSEGPHGLSVGAPVLIHWDYDATQPETVVRYFFWALADELCGGT